MLSTDIDLIALESHRALDKVTDHNRLLLRDLHPDHVLHPCVQLLLDLFRSQFQTQTIVECREVALDRELPKSLESADGQNGNEKVGTLGEVNSLEQPNSLPGAPESRSICKQVPAPRAIPPSPDTAEHVRSVEIHSPESKSNEFVHPQFILTEFSRNLPQTHLNVWAEISGQRWRTFVRRQMTPAEGFLDVVDVLSSAPNLSIGGMERGVTSTTVRKTKTSGGISQQLHPLIQRKNNERKRIRFLPRLYPRSGG